MTKESGDPTLIANGAVVKGVREVFDVLLTRLNAKVLSAMAEEYVVERREETRFDHETAQIQNNAFLTLKMGASLFREKAVVANISVLLKIPEWEELLALPLTPEQLQPGKPDPIFGTQERRLLAELRGGILALLTDLDKADSEGEIAQTLRQLVENSACPTPDTSIKDACIEALTAMTDEERREILAQWCSACGSSAACNCHRDE